VIDESERQLEKQNEPRISREQGIMIFDELEKL
jgi:hypothetical protein